METDYKSVLDAKSKEFDLAPDVEDWEPEQDEIFFQMEPRPQRLIYQGQIYEDWEIEALEAFDDFVNSKGV